MTITEFIHRRTGRKAYAVRDESTKLYFIWCYTTDTFAETIADKITIKDAQDQQVNWRASLDQLVLSERTNAS